MANGKLDQWFTPKQALGIECLFTKTNSQYFLVHQSIKKEEIEVIQKVTFSSIGALKEFISKNKKLTNFPCAVSITGEGLLHQTLDQSHLNFEEALNQVLPSASTNDFYIQLIKNEHDQIISLARRDQIDRHLQQLQGVGLSITQLALGSFDIKLLAPYLVGQEIQSNHQKLYFASTNELTFKDQLTTDVVDYSLEGESISSDYISAFAAAFKSLMHSEQNPIHPDPTTHARHLFFEVNKIKKTGILALGLIFGLLLFSSMMYLHYFQKNQDLGSQLGLHQNTIKKSEYLQTELQQYRQLNQNGNSHAAFYADRIAASIPPKIKLGTLDIFPLIKSKSNQPEKVKQYDNKKIILSGFCSDCLVVNNWNKSMQTTYPWIQKITVMHCGLDRENKGIFELQIELK